MVRERSSLATEWLLALVLLVPQLAYSQQPSDPGSTQDPGSGNPPAPAQTTGTESGANQSEPNAAATTPGLFARALNSAGPLPGDKGPLQWGWFSITSASFSQYFNNVTIDNAGLPPVSQDVSASQLSTSIVVSHAFGAARLTKLTVQYTPSLFIAEGHVYTDALNQSAGLDTTFQLSPRWSMQISDRFSYFGNQRYYTGLSLGVDYSLGTVAQNSFLNGPGRVIYDTAGAAFSYLWSPVTTVSFSPSFGYQNSSGAVNSGQNLSALYGGAQLTVSHALTASQTVGVSYLGQYASYTNTSTSAGPQTNGLLQDFLVSYGKRIGASWRLSAGLGITSNTSGGSQAGLAASGGVTKSFHKMDVALNYYRGHQFNGYVTSASTDRVDLVNTIRWSRRLTTSTSGAYFRTTGGTPGPSGIYATEQFSFGLTRTLSFTSSVAYTEQTGDAVYVQSGHTRLASVGITWSPASTTQY
jgi:hypothetical protein